MKLPTALPRQPFLGLAISAMVGILAADHWPNQSTVVAAILAAVAIAAWFSRRSLVVYGLVAIGFFFLHGERTVDSPGMQLARALGNEPRPVTVRGAVITEPKISERGSASFRVCCAGADGATVYREDTKFTKAVTRPWTST